MITCGVCGKLNDDLSVVCSSCKGFLQGRVDALNLFESLWGLIETPRATFKRIVLAKHKNYVLLLASLFGICLLLDIAWYKALGERFSGLITLVGTCIGLGVPAGMVFVLGISAIVRTITKWIGGNATLKNMYAAVSYATAPMVFSLVVFIPLEIAIFGNDFFGTNPPPMIIKPTEYSILIALKGIAALYALYLLITGTMVANAFQSGKTLVVSIAIAVLMGVFGLGIHLVTI